jgi:Holliday junction DNA helicase RuvB
VANRLLKRVRDYAQVRADNRISHEVAREALRLFEIDDDGSGPDGSPHLCPPCTGYLAVGRLGVDSLSAVVGEEAATIEDVYEPFLLQLGSSCSERLEAAV